MAVPIMQAVRVGKYVVTQHLKKRKRYPLVLMLEPLFRCNLACAGCGKIDLTRVSCVRAFMGQPHLLLLEDPLEGGPPELYNSFLSSITEARDRGAGVIWLVRSNAVWQSYRQGITSTWRLADDGLVAVRMA